MLNSLEPCIVHRTLFKGYTTQWTMKIWIICVGSYVKYFEGGWKDILGWKGEVGNNKVEKGVSNKKADIQPARIQYPEGFKWRQNKQYWLLNLPLLPRSTLTILLGNQGTDYYPKNIGWVCWNAVPEPNGCSPTRSFIPRSFLLQSSSLYSHILSIRFPDTVLFSQCLSSRDPVVTSQNTLIILPLPTDPRLFHAHRPWLRTSVYSFKEQKRIVPITESDFCYFR